MKSATVADTLAGMAQGDVPAEAADPGKVDIKEIPLPPARLVDELDNQAPAASGPAAGEPEVATLDFCGGEPAEATFPLKYPFRWEGVRHDAITVRQITTARIGQIFARCGQERRAPELFDFYAAMTGLPAKVLRALPAVDGEPIIDKAWDFLPPSLRPEEVASAPTPPSG